MITLTARSTAAPRALRRGPLLITALAAAVGGAAIYLVAWPGIWRLSVPFGLVFAGLGAAQLATVVLVLHRPQRRRIRHAAVAAVAVIVLWAPVRLAGIVPGADPWAPLDTVMGFTDYLCATLQLIAATVLTVSALRVPRPRPAGVRRVLAAAAVLPLTMITLVGTLVGVAAAGNGLPDTVAPAHLPAGQRSTVEYCRPAGVPLAMDLYTPRSGKQPAPAVLYIHGGGLIWGDRQPDGFGANLANQDGALFTPLTQRLNARGFLVAAIDYRLAPAARWPAPIEDAKCAIRFLRAHAAGLNLDPSRIGVWGSSAGALLASLVGLAGRDAGFDTGQYTDQPSSVQVVVDLFGPSEITDFADAGPLPRLTAWLSIGSSTSARHAASPVNHITTAAPPFLILHGTLDTDIPIQHSRQLARRLRSAGIPTTLIEVAGTAHTLATPGQHPSTEQLADTAADFLSHTLG